jgi:hypothetical protein
MGETIEMPSGEDKRIGRFQRRPPREGRVALRLLLA